MNSNGLYIREEDGRNELYPFDFIEYYIAKDRNKPSPIIPHHNNERYRLTEKGRAIHEYLSQTSLQ